MKGDGGNMRLGRRWLDEGPGSDPARLALRRALDEADAQLAPSDLDRQRALARIELPWARSETARSRGRGLVWLGGLGLACAAVALFGGFWPGSLGPSGWHVLSQRFAHRPTPATAPRAASSGDADAAPRATAAAVALTTAPGERATHRLPRGVQAELFPRTALVPGTESNAPEVTVGRVRFSVPHQAPGRTYAVHAGGYEVVVLGTVFTVAVEDRGVSVSVESGVVEVREGSSGQTIGRLYRGQGWSSDHAPADDAAASAWPEPVRETRHRRHGSAERAVARTGAKPGAASFGAGRMSATMRGFSAHGAAGTGRGAAARTLALAPPMTDEPLAKETAAVRSRELEVPATSAAGGATGLAAARKARKDGDPKRAVGLYEKIARAGGPLAESALYEMGTITLQDLHDPDGALAIWEGLRARFPEGLVRAEVDLDLLELRAQRGDGARALEEARGFLRRHPTSERRGEIARVAADLERMRGDCGAALPLYAEASKSRVGADREDAAFYRGLCLLTLGDAGARAALDGYLDRFPEGRHAAEAGRILQGGAPARSGAATSGATEAR